MKQISLLLSFWLLASLSIQAAVLVEDFESPTFSNGTSLQNYSGWTVPTGAASITGSDAYDGAQAVLLQAADPATEIVRDLSSYSGNIQFTDLYVKPVATSPGSFNLLNQDEVVLWFSQQGGAGVFEAIDGTNSLQIPFAFTLDAGSRTQDWIRLTFRQDSSADTYDVYVNEALVGTNLSLQNPIAGPFQFQLYGDVANDTYLDVFTYGDANPLYVDVDLDGLPDDWESTHGVSDRAVDEEPDQLANIDEYRYGTDPNVADTDSDGIDDGDEVALGTDPLTDDGTLLAYEPFDYPAGQNVSYPLSGYGLNPSFNITAQQNNGQNIDAFVGSSLGYDSLRLAGGSFSKGNGLWWYENRMEMRLDQSAIDYINLSGSSPSSNTYWLSFVGRTPADIDSKAASLRLFWYGDHLGVNIDSLTNQADVWVKFHDGSIVRDEAQVVQPDTTYLYLLKVDVAYVSSQKQVSLALWVYEEGVDALPIAEPTNPEAQLSNVLITTDWPLQDIDVRYYSHENLDWAEQSQWPGSYLGEDYQVDEIRLGTTFEAVLGAQHGLETPPSIPPGTGGAVQVATPSITPSAGSYEGSVEVTLATSTSGATIYYTTDGSAPTTSSAVYSAPFTLTTSATVKAFAVKAGDLDSTEASASFTIITDVAAPTISPDGGSFVNSVEVTLATATAGATIHYTTDGSAPTTASPVYSAPFTLTADATVQALAVKAGLNDSAVTSASFTMTTAPAADAPVITPNGGSFSGSVQVSMSTATSGASIYYTTDGSTPTTASTLYTGSFSLSADASVKAMAAKAGLSNSSITTTDFNLITPQGTLHIYEPFNYPAGAGSAHAVTGSGLQGFIGGGHFDISANSLGFASLETAAGSLLKVNNLYWNDSATQFTLSEPVKTLLNPSSGQSTEQWLSFVARTPSAFDGQAVSLRISNGAETFGVRIDSDTDQAEAFVRLQNGTVFQAAAQTIQPDTTYFYLLKFLLENDGTDHVSLELWVFEEGEALPVGTPSNPEAVLHDVNMPSNWQTTLLDVHYDTQTVPNATYGAYQVDEIRMGTSSAIVLPGSGGASAEQVSAPVIAPANGSHDRPIEVTLSTATSGATIHYTMDGSTPTAASPVYSGPFTIAEDTTVQAYAIKAGSFDSHVSSTAFVIDIAPLPQMGTSYIYEPFDYPVGTLTDQTTSAQGLDEIQSSNGGYNTIAMNSLAFESLHSETNHLLKGNNPNWNENSLVYQLEDTFENLLNLNTSSSEEFWLSFTTHTPADLDNRSFSLGFFDNGDHYGIDIDTDSNQAGVFFDYYSGSDLAAAARTILPDTTYTFLLKINLDNTSGKKVSLALWVYEAGVDALPAGEPVNPEAALNDVAFVNDWGIDRLTIASRTSSQNPGSLEPFAMDELRVGDGFRAALPHEGLDLDGDGMPDRWEMDNGLDPESAADASGDADGDGRSNLDEYLQGTHPNVSDNDPSVDYFYVDNVAGNDSSSGENIPAAKQSIASAISAAATGDVIIILQGSGNYDVQDLTDLLGKDLTFDLVNNVTFQ